MKSLRKIKIATILISALLMNQIVYAGYFFFDNGVKKYVDDNGNYAVGWRWLDLNSDNIAECYRFNENGELATKSVFKGKDINDDGQWVINGIVQRMYLSTERPLYKENAALGETDTNEYFTLSTDSGTRRLNATKKKNLKDLIISDLNKDESDRLRSLVGPKATFSEPEEGYMISKGAKAAVNRRPIATMSSWVMIDDAMREDEVRVLTASDSVVAGRDVRRFVSASNKYTEKVNNVKIYGGDVWNDVSMLQGNGAYMKMTTTGGSNNKFRANYFTFEVAHQTHGESTADTYCGIELYLNGKSIEVYDDFCDGEPETVEVYLDENESTVELRAIVTGDAPGRKLYIRNARFRQLRERKDE